MKKSITKLAFLLCAFLLVMPLLYGQGSVSRSGSTWTARVNNTTVYSGTRMFDAINAACNNMGAGTINIWNSGDSGPAGNNIYGIRPQANQTLNFNNHTVNCNGGDLVVGIYADRRNGITIQNLRVTGAPRYGMWFRGSSGVTLENITMELSHPGAVGLGIRVDDSSGAASNLTIKGTIFINGAKGHGIETYGINGITIGDVTVNNNGGCGLILNNSRNATVGVVAGYRNNWGGGYATFRVANNNGPNIRVKKVHSRESGRGFFSVSGSNGCIVEEVDIANSWSHGIFLEDATDTHVLSGSVSNGNPNTQMVRTTNCTINLGPPAGSNNATINGTYALVAVHSGKALDVYNWGTSDGTNIAQWDYWGGDAQRFTISNLGSEWHRISPVIAPSKSLDVDGVSSNNGANIHIWHYWGGNGQQFRFQNAGSGRYRIIARNSGKCLDVQGRSTANGANVAQWECISGATNQMFQLVSLKSGSVVDDIFEEDKKSDKFSISPNPSTGNFVVTIPSTQEICTTNISVLDLQGRTVHNVVTTETGNITVNTALSAGIYIIVVENKFFNNNDKIVIK